MIKCFYVLPGVLWLLHWETLFQRQKLDFYLFTVTGFDLWLSVLTLGIVCTIYTALVNAVSLRGGKRSLRRGNKEKKKRKIEIR